MAKTSCPQCNTNNLDDDSLVEGLVEVAEEFVNPVKWPSIISRVGSGFFRMGFSWAWGEKITSGNLMKCSSCQSYATECFHCKHTFALHTRPKTYTVVTCPKCSNKICLL